MGFLSETDNSIFIETKNNKRIIHHRSTKFPARTVLNDLPDFEPVEQYDLQKHIDVLSKLSDNVENFAL